MKIKPNQLGLFTHPTYMRTPSAPQPCSTEPVLRVLPTQRAPIIVIMVHKRHPLMWFRQQKPLKKWLKSHTLYVVYLLHGLLAAQPPLSRNGVPWEYSVLRYAS